METTYGCNKTPQLLVSSAGLYVSEGDYLLFVTDIHVMTRLLCVVEWLVKFTESFVIFLDAVAKDC
jgi:hypothetical protein